MLRVEREQVFAVMLDIEEYQAIEKVDEVLEDLITRFGTENSLMSAETGEVFGIEELTRVRSILECLHKFRCFQIHPERLGGCPL